jgi:hypothetical protein
MASFEDGPTWNAILNWNQQVWRNIDDDEL